MYLNKSQRESATKSDDQLRHSGRNGPEVDDVLAQCCGDVETDACISPAVVAGVEERISGREVEAAASGFTRFREANDVEIDVFSFSFKFGEPRLRGDSSGVVRAHIEVAPHVELQADTPRAG